jgi:hypothetical protein
MHLPHMQECNLNLMMQGVLGVFLREPLADWQREARLLQAGATADAEEEYISLKVGPQPQQLSRLVTLPLVVPLVPLVHLSLQ